MARPAPDPELVVAVFELASEGVSYRAIIDQMQKEHGIAISVGTVSAWVKIGASWWNRDQRLSPAEEYAGQRGIIGWLIGEARRAYDAGQIDFATMEQSMHRSLNRHARLTGVDAPTQVAVNGPAAIGPPQPSAAQVAAIENMRERVLAKERKVISGG